MNKENVIRQTNLPVCGSFLIKYPRYSDDRGFLQEIYNRNAYKPYTLDQVAQVTISSSIKNVIRGIHRTPYSKLVTCIKGCAYDIVVDLRPHSPSYLLWVGVKLSEKNRKQIYIPAHCGHAFLCISNKCMVAYLQPICFDSGIDEAFRWDDTNINIFWPIEDNSLSKLSSRDIQAPLIHEKLPLPINTASNRRRILVIGASGQVGAQLVQTINSEYCKLFTVYSTYHNTFLLNRNLGIQFDLKLDSTIGIDSYQSLLEICYPNIVILCSAFTWVDGCEREPKLAYEVNANSVFELALACNEINAKLVYISTDYVFGGAPPSSSNNKYTESDTISPLNIYGRTKHRGEEFTMIVNANNLVVRTSSVYGLDRNKKNFPYQLLKNLGKKKQFEAFTDMYSTPTYSLDLSLAIMELICKNTCGTLHVSGTESISRYDWAIRIASVWNFNRDLVIPTLTKSKLLHNTNRPYNSSLSSMKLYRFLPLFRMRDMNAALIDWKYNEISFLTKTVNKSKL